MASEIKVNTIKDLGGNTIVSSNGSGTITGLPASAISSGTVATARLGSGTASSSTFLAGDSSYKTVSGTTINNNADNRVITGSGTANTLEGESNLTYDGTTFQLSQASPKFKILPTTNGNDGVLEICGRSTDGSPTENRTQIKGEAEGSTANTKMTFHVENASGVNEKMVISSGGNLGVGIASPETTAHIQSASGDCELRLTAASTSDARLRFGDVDDTDAGYIGYNRNNGAMYIRSKTSGGANMSLDSSGRVIVGSTTPIDTNANMSVYATDNYPLATKVGATGNTQQIGFNNGNGHVGGITTNGSATAFNTSSDYRLKENINYDFDASTRLKQLKPARFNFKTDTSKTVDGFLAHEVSSIVPESITGNKDAIETKQNVILNANGTMIYNGVLEQQHIEGKEKGTYPSDSTWIAEKEVPVYQSIDQAKLVPLLTRALQEAITKIETLETKVTALENA